MTDTLARHAFVDSLAELTESLKHLTDELLEKGIVMTPALGRKVHDMHNKAAALYEAAWMLDADNMSGAHGSGEGGQSYAHPY
jgi:hypothetical protein